MLPACSALRILAGNNPANQVESLPTYPSQPELRKSGEGRDLAGCFGLPSFATFAGRCPEVMQRVLVYQAAIMAADGIWVVLATLEKHIVQPRC